VRLWRVSDGTAMITLEGHTSFVMSIAFSPNGTALASGSDDRTIRFWGIPAKG
jgi:WD40 repeat protein